MENVFLVRGGLPVCEVNSKSRYQKRTGMLSKTPKQKNSPNFFQTMYRGSVIKKMFRKRHYQVQVLRTRVPGSPGTWYSFTKCENEKRNKIISKATGHFSKSVFGQAVAVEAVDVRLFVIHCVGRGPLTPSNTLKLQTTVIWILFQATQKTLTEK